jgi:protein SCO1/2
LGSGILSYAHIIDFHPKFVGLTGTHSQILKVAKQYRLYFSAPPRALDDDNTDYLVDHSIFFYLMGPKGEFLSHFGRNESAQEISTKILQFMQQK